MADAIVVGATMGPPEDGETWQDWLVRRARAYRRSLLAHRDGARVVATASALSPSTVVAFNDELTALVGCGFPPDPRPAHDRDDHPVRARVRAPGAERARPVRRPDR
ncbi:TetR/AcrR family transcriptional regulator C-terminal domain-containing protein [Umezawaea tangerina]|uniref:TetR/AcrR family transcriptional regulator C-terminal domain-containing protein n=1 Tax=Umezawaea tangerina TaxID=84725 RepID=UPI000D06EB0D